MPPAPHATFKQQLVQRVCLPLSDSVLLVTGSEGCVPHEGLVTSLLQQIAG